MNLELTREPVEDVDVYFDDFSVLHSSQGMAVVQVDDYTPFGLRINSYQSQGSMLNCYLFNSGSELNRETDNYETFFREYDLALGRFHAIDPKAMQFASWSPYQYGFNDPMFWNDPLGAEGKHASMADIVNELMSFDHGGKWTEDGGSVPFGSSSAAFEAGVAYNNFFNSWSTTEFGSYGAAVAEYRRISGNSTYGIGFKLTGTYREGGRYNYNSLSGNEQGPGNGGNIYTEQTGTFSYFQPSYLLIEGVGVAGSFNVKGSYRIANNPDGTWSLYVGASGKTPASGVGKVTFYGKANLIVNGVDGKAQSFTIPNNLVYESGISPIGLTSFTLPETGYVQLQLNITYQFSGPEGRAVPMQSMKRIINIPLYNPGYFSPK